MTDVETADKNVKQILEESKINDDFNTNGIQLLKRGKKGLLSILFSRTGIVILLLVLQVALITLWIGSLREYMPHYMVFMGILDAFMAILVINSPMDSTAKITWLVIISILPVFGALFYLYCWTNLGHRKLKQRVEDLTEKEKDLIIQDPDVLREVKEISPETAGMAHYIRRTGCYPIYNNTDVRYFPMGEDMLETMLWELDKAEEVKQEIVNQVSANYGSYDIPKWALPYIVNGDASGISDHEQELVDKFLEKNFPDGFIPEIEEGQDKELNRYPAFGERKENALTDRGESPYLAVDTVSVKFSEPGYMENVSDKKDDGYSYETVVDNTKEQIAAKTPPKEEEQEEVHFHRGR